MYLESCDWPCSVSAHLMTLMKITLMVSLFSNSQESSGCSERNFIFYQSINKCSGSSSIGLSSHLHLSIKSFWGRLLMTIHWQRMQDWLSWVEIRSDHVMTAELKGRHELLMTFIHPKDDIFRVSTKLESKFMYLSISINTLFLLVFFPLNFSWNL